MYWFGKTSDNNEWKEQASWEQLKDIKKKLAQLEIDLIISILDDFSKVWKPGSQIVEDCIGRLIMESGFSEDEVRSTLSLLPGLLSRESLEKRIRSEFIDEKILDRFTKTPHFSGLVKAVPKVFFYTSQLVMFF